MGSLVCSLMDSDPLAGPVQIKSVSDYQKSFFGFTVDRPPAAGAQPDDFPKMMIKNDSERLI